jgi:hypothetical protein
VETSGRSVSATVESSAHPREGVPVTVDATDAVTIEMKDVVAGTEIDRRHRTGGVIEHTDEGVV